MLTRAIRRLCKGETRHGESPSFTAHNIRLDDGTETKPEIGFTMADHPNFVSARRLLSLLYPKGTSKIRIADLGCLEGGYSVEFARLGFDVLGLEVRDANIAACRYVKDHVNLPNLRFVQDDAWNVAKHGPFHVVFCCGLFYHIDRPVEFLRLLATITEKMLILQTHFATGKPNPQFQLSEQIEKDPEGYHGRWLMEFPDDAAFAQRDAARWASWDNRRSFWLRRPDLLQAIVDAGFDACFEQFDGLGHIATSLESGFYNTDSRGTFIGVKTELGPTR
jgi:SAM-dependent methyltransferase